MVGGKQVGRVQCQKEKKKYVMAVALTLPPLSPHGGATLFLGKEARLLKCLDLPGEGKAANSA